MKKTDQETFVSYAKALGVPNEKITSFEDLNKFIDENEEFILNPPFKRLSVPTLKIETNWKKNIRSLHNREYKKNIQDEPDWVNDIRNRRNRILLFSFVATIIIVNISFSGMFISYDIHDISQNIYLFLYIFFTFYSFYSFSKMIVGFRLALGGPKRNPYHPSHTACDPKAEDKCAILYPVYHEDMHRVGAGIESIIQSIIEHIPEHKHLYNIFLLSDSRDENYVLTEQATIYFLKRRYPEIGIFYRHRPNNANAKLGNVIDFLRRWGTSYPFLYMMDADSIVSAKSIHQCLRMICGKPKIGIIQTNPLPVLRESFFGRLFQFSSHLYGSFFSYSLESLSMGHANYIGHNAIIRTDAFIKYCILPELSGKRPWGGKPLSHDIAESAMMSRAGFEVWFLADVKESYEEIPANASGFLMRENRWMQGNIQNIRFLFSNGLQSLHRESLLTGALGYALAPLSLLFMLASAYAATHMNFLDVESIDFDELKISLIGLFVISLVFVFSPRLIALTMVLFSSNSKYYGGKLKLLLSFILETLFSFIYNPIVMSFIIKFLISYIKRTPIKWTSQQRDDAPMSFFACIKEYYWCSCIGVLSFYLLQKSIEEQSEKGAELIDLFSDGLMSSESIMFWFAPIFLGLIFAPLIVFFSSKTSNFLNKAGWFRIPQETSEPDIVTKVKNNLINMKKHFPGANENILDYALTSPEFYIFHYRHIKIRPLISARLVPKIRKGDRLTPKEVMIAMKERNCFIEMVKYHKKNQKSI